MNPTCQQLDNARRLADTLDKVAAEYPEHFDMKEWVGGDGGDFSMSKLLRHAQGEHPADCGTTGCALGWAPYALGEPLLKDEEWENYGERVLGVTRHHHWKGYLFHDQTAPNGADGARAAAARLREYVAEFEGDCTDG